MLQNGSVAVSVNPASLLDILALLLRRKKERKDKVIEYVESIANEAASLAGVSQKLFDELAQGKSITPETHPELADEIHRHSMPNAPNYTRLLEFYNWVSAALGDKLDGWHRDSLVDHLARLLRARDLTLQAYRTAESKYVRQPVFFLGSDNETVDVGDLAQSVAALHREAAALHILAKTLRASD